MPSPPREAFDKLTASGARTIVWKDLLADLETPLSAYWKLAHDATYSFLLESVTGGEQLARYSVLGVNPTAVVRTKDRDALTEMGGQGLRFSIAEGKDPLDLVAPYLSPLAGEMPADMPPFVGGAVGLMGYDLVRSFESLPDAPPDDLGTDDLAMLIVDDVVVFDHAKNRIRIVAVAGEGEYDAAVARIEQTAAKLAGPLPELPPAPAEPPPQPLPLHQSVREGAPKSNMAPEAFEANVRTVKEYIAAGDGVQMVLSQRFQTPVQAHPLSVYRALRSLNPSPYMFLMRLGGYDLVGASPELMVSLHGRTARVRPIAGTRQRGQNPEEDDRLAEELLADEKERAEHVMLVDLGRNDLGRVCEYGSIQVGELMVIERYSHVMHIVSDVSGTLREGLDAFDLVRACFPAGTVSGAPKVRAMQIIDELEPTRRGPYAGAVGFFSHSGDFDSCIAIRTILMKGGIAYVQAGAGLVYDSDPAKERAESENKARAALRAIELAQVGL